MMSMFDKSMTGEKYRDKTETRLGHRHAIILTYPQLYYTIHPAVAGAYMFCGVTDLEKDCYHHHQWSKEFQWKAEIYII